MDHSTGVGGGAHGAAAGLEVGQVVDKVIARAAVLELYHPARRLQRHNRRRHLPVLGIRHDDRLEPGVGVAPAPVDLGGGLGAGLGQLRRDVQLGADVPQAQTLQRGRRGGLQPPP